MVLQMLCTLELYSRVWSGIGTSWMIC